MKGMGEGREFPCAQMGRQKKNSLATCDGALEVLEPVVNHYLSNVLGRVVGEEADFGELTSEGDVFASKDAAPFHMGYLWKSQGQVAHAHVAQASVEQVDD